MLRSTIFSTISGGSFDHIDNNQIIDDILVTLATGSEASTAIVDIALNKAQAPGWRSRFAKLDKSILIWEERQTATGVVRHTHYAGFIDKVAVEGASNGGVTLSIRLSDPAELLKMIQLSADKTYKAATWAGIIKQIVADAFSQPNTPHVTIEGGMEPGEAVTFEAVVGAEGTTYSALIEEVKEASNGGYAEVAFTPNPQEFQGQLTGVTWTATAMSELINLSKTVDIEDDDNVYGFTIDAHSNSNFSRLVLKNAEGARKTYTNPNGGTLLSDEVLAVDADEADFDAIAAAYMQSENLATSESHEVGVKMKLADVRGTVGAGGVLPKAVEYNWSTSTRLRVVQAEYRIGVTTKAWNGLEDEEAATVPVDLTFAPVSNKTWVPPSRANSDNTNQDWIDKNKYSGVGRDSFNGAKPGEYGGGGGGDTPDPGGSGNPEIPEFPADPAWWAGSEPMEFPEEAQGRARPVYGFELSDPQASRPVSVAAGTTPGPADDPEWWTGWGVATGQSHDSKKAYWSFWSSSDERAFAHRVHYNGAISVTHEPAFVTDQGVSLPMSPGREGNDYVNIVPLALSDLKLVVCEADLVDGQFSNPKRVAELTIDHELHKFMTLGLFMVGSQADYDFVEENGIGEHVIQNSNSRRRSGAEVVMGIRGIYTTSDRIILMYETFIGVEGSDEITANTVRTITIRKGEDGEWATPSGFRAISNGGAIKLWTPTTHDEEEKGLVGLFNSTFRGGETWFGAMSTKLALSRENRVAGAVFNLHHGNSIDPSSYNYIPSVTHHGELDVAQGTNITIQTTIARSADNRGMSLYLSVAAQNSSIFHEAFEFPLAENMIAGRTSGQKWKVAALYPNLTPGAYPYAGDYGYSAGSGQDHGATIMGSPVVLGSAQIGSGDSLYFNVVHISRIFPSDAGGWGVTWYGSYGGEGSAYDSLNFTRVSAGVENTTGLSPAQRAIRGAHPTSMIMYSEGFLYALSFSARIADLGSNYRSVMSEPGLESHPFWWYSVRLDPLSEPKPQIGNSAYAFASKYNDVPINPAARREGWTPGPVRYPSQELYVPTEEW